MNNTREVFDLIRNKDLYELLRRKEKYSEYIEGEYNEHFENLINEVKELNEVINSGDLENIQGEINDVIYVFFQVMNKLNKDNMLEGLSLKKHKDKILHRSPNLKKCEKVSREIENKIWNIMKNK